MLVERAGGLMKRMIAVTLVGLGAVILFAVRPAFSQDKPDAGWADPDSVAAEAEAQESEQFVLGKFQRFSDGQVMVQEIDLDNGPGRESGYLVSPETQFGNVDKVEQL